MRAPGLRLRMALFFVALAALCVASVVLGGLVAVHEGLDPASLVAPAAVAVFGIALSAALIALLFDENVARPIDALAAALRARAHGKVSVPLSPRMAKHLADLAPAAAAVCDRLAEIDGGVESRLATATAELEAQKAQLCEILSEIPIAVMAIDRGHRIRLYDRQCVHALGAVATLGLGRSVFRYFDEAAFRAAEDRLDASGGTVTTAVLPTADGASTIAVRLRRTGEGGTILSMEAEQDVIAERPLVFDFALLDRPVRGADLETPLAALPFVIFDTETTGLDPARDEIVQIGAVRALNGRLVSGETFETLVDPGRPIPAVASRVHGITDEMVSGKLSPRTAVAAFDFFSRGEILVAHNAPFDMALVSRHARIGAFDGPVLDTVLLSAALFGESETHTLDAIAERLGVSISAVARHTAMGDAVATAQVLLHMIPMLNAAGVITLGDAIAAMRRHQRLMPQSRTLFQQEGSRRSTG